MKTSPNKSLTIIVINDYRSLSLAAAYSIAKGIKENNILLITSKRFIRFKDYGQYFPSFYKLLKIIFLKLFLKIAYAPKTNDISFDKSMDMGVASSLQSITLDSLASAEKYPIIYSHLREQAIGSKEISEYICAISPKPSIVYLFNGRTASSSSITSSLHYNDIPIKYYEQSLRGGGYQVYPYPCHNSLQLGKDLMDLWRWTVTPAPDLFINGLNYEKKKLRNPFVNDYKLTTHEDFDIAVFLGSDHEYTNLQLDIVNMSVIGNFELLKYVKKKYGSNKSIAVRAHPNQKNDKSSSIILNEVIIFCREHGFTFYGPDSGVSSHDLIRRSSLIVVEYSSIAYDAIFLGAKVDIVGDLDLKTILNAISNKDEPSTQDKRYRVREILTLYNDLFFYRYPSTLILPFFIRAANYLDRKISGLSKFRFN